MSTPCSPATGVPKPSRSAARPRLQPLDQRRQQELRRSRQPRRFKRSNEIAGAFHDRVQAPDLGDERPHLVGRVAALDRVELARGLQVGQPPAQLRLAPRLRLLDGFLGQRSDAQTLFARVGRLEHEGMVVGAVRTPWLRRLLTAIAAPLAEGCSRHTVSPHPIRRRDARVAPSTNRSTAASASTGSCRSSR
jgi:hypothetical protein